MRTKHGYGLLPVCENEQTPGGGDVLVLVRAAHPTLVIHIEHMWSCHKKNAVGCAVRTKHGYGLLPVCENEQTPGGGDVLLSVRVAHPTLVIHIEHMWLCHKKMR